jgi:hypothetical protein
VAQVAVKLAMLHFMEIQQGLSAGVVLRAEGPDQPVVDTLRRKAASKRLQ